MTAPPREPPGTEQAGARAGRARWVRVARFTGVPVRVSVDGIAHEAHAGESVLSAVLAVLGHARLNEFDGGKRAGFCVMGACQDCWVWVDGGRRVRGCGTEVAEGMAISTSAPRLEAADG
ncbi:MAG: (2Fe-2S)-binding protein [Alphaproteobacteria bacterium]|nr:(2Fe-2S)-binding protein [Alphaproteobacteria bacterium]